MLTSATEESRRRGRGEQEERRRRGGGEESSITASCESPLHWERVMTALLSLWMEHWGGSGPSPGENAKICEWT